MGTSRDAHGDREEGDRYQTQVGDANHLVAASEARGAARGSRFDDVHAQIREKRRQQQSRG